MMRRRLPNRRASETFTLHWGSLKFVPTVSRLADETLAEIFLSNAKCDLTADTIARDRRWWHRSHCNTVPASRHCAGHYYAMRGRRPGQDCLYMISDGAAP